jgi:hypothetical protein
MIGTEGQLRKRHWEKSQKRTSNEADCPLLFSGFLIFMGKLFTKEFINEKIKDRKIFLIGEYKTSHKRVLYKCEKGHEWMGVTSNILRGWGCPSCAGRSPLEAAKKVEDVAKQRKYKVLVPYTRSKIPLTLECEYGHVFKIKADKLRIGQGCNICGSCKNLKTDIFHQRMAIKNTGIVALDPIKNNSEKIRFRCKNGHEFKTSPAILLMGCGCEICSGRRLSIEDVKSRLLSRGIELIGNYSNTTSKANLRCKEGHTWSAVITHLINNRKGCPYCTPHGFKPNLPATFYLFLLIVNGQSIVGIGVTNNFKTRQIQHRYAFKKAEIKWTLLQKIYFESGAKARELEQAILAGQPTINIGISGFKRECLPVEMMPFIQSKIASYTNQQPQLHIQSSLKQ